MKVYCGNNIRRLREGAGLTQRELASKMGVAHTTIASWEKNRTEPKMGAIEQMAAIFGCNKTDIIPNAPDTFFERRAEDIELVRKNITELESNIRVFPLSSSMFVQKLEEKNLTIEKLSELTGIETDELLLISEHDQTYVSWATLRKLQKYLTYDILHWTNSFGQTKAIEDIFTSAASNFSILSATEQSIIHKFRAADKITKAMVLKALDIEDKKIY